MSFAGTIADKAVDYAIENPQQVLSVGKTAIGMLANTDEEPSPFRPYLVGGAVGLVIGFALAAWMSSSAPMRRNDDDELLRSLWNQASVRGHRPAALRPW